MMNWESRGDSEIVEKADDQIVGDDYKRKSNNSRCCLIANLSSITRRVSNGVHIRW